MKESKSITIVKNNKRFSTFLARMRGEKNLSSQDSDKTLQHQKSFFRHKSGNIKDRYKFA